MVDTIKLPGEVAVSYASFMNSGKGPTGQVFVFTYKNSGGQPVTHRLYDINVKFLVPLKAIADTREIKSFFLGKCKIKQNAVPERRMTLEFPKVHITAHRCVNITPA